MIERMLWWPRPAYASGLPPLSDDERRRLLGGRQRSRPRRRSQGAGGRSDPMDAFVYAVIGVMAAVTFVYCVVMLRSPAEAAGALQGLLAVVPIGVGVLALRKERNGD